MHLDGVPFQLKEAHDFTWIHNLGHVFKIFDRQDSGHIGFGIDQGHRRLFLKVAGAKTINYDGDPADAVALLRDAVRPPEALRHPSLVSLIDHFAVGEDYAALFEWFDGEVLHSLEYPPPAKYHDPRSPYYRFRQLPISTRLDALQTIFDYHRFVESKGWVAVDLYDGSILYDFAQGAVRVCDIDYYRPGPFTLTADRLPGSKRFMAPEEFQRGALIDHRTNVFAMGAAAFVLLGGELDRSAARWEAGDVLHAVALRAVSPDRADRQASVAEFAGQWTAARRAARL